MRWALGGGNDELRFALAAILLVAAYLYALWRTRDPWRAVVMLVRPVAIDWWPIATALPLILYLAVAR